MILFCDAYRYWLIIKWQASLPIGQVETTIEYICQKEGEGAILVFLTGWEEISKLHEKLKGNILLGDSNRFLVLPVHGSMPTISQREIFDRPPNGVRYKQNIPIFSMKFCSN